MYSCLERVVYHLGHHTGRVAVLLADRLNVCYQEEVDDCPDSTRAFEAAHFDATGLCRRFAGVGLVRDCDKLLVIPRDFRHGCGSKLFRNGSTQLTRSECAHDPCFDQGRFGFDVRPLAVEMTA